MFSIAFSRNNLSIISVIMRDNAWKIRQTNANCKIFLDLEGPSLNSLNSANLGNLINHRKKNCVEVKDPLCYLRIADAVLTSLSLHQSLQV